MSRRCDLTGKAVQTGNLVSHSNHKTRTRFLPNLCNVTLISDTLQRKLRFRVAAAALRSSSIAAGSTLSSSRPTMANSRPAPSRSSARS